MRHGLFPQEEHKNRCGGHKAQTADLNQTEDDNLTKSAPLGPGIAEHQAGDAGGGGSREQRGAKSAGNAAAGRGGQGQKHRPQQNDDAKGQGNDPGWVYGFPAFRR